MHPVPSAKTSQKSFENTLLITEKLWHDYSAVCRLIPDIPEGSRLLWPAFLILQDLSPVHFVSSLFHLEYFQAESHSSKSQRHSPVSSESLFSPSSTLSFSFNPITINIVSIFCEFVKVLFLYWKQKIYQEKKFPANFSEESLLLFVSLGKLLC